MTARENYLEFKKNYDEAKDSIGKVAKQALYEMSLEVFEKFPAISSFGWPEYAMYFNDGDPTYFFVYNDPDSIYINGEGPYDDEDDDDEDLTPEVPKHKLTAKDKETARELFSEILKQFDDETMESNFTEDGKVTIFRDGRVKISDYRHS